MTQKITLYLLAGSLFLSLISNAQSVGIGTETPNSNAILELVAPNNDQGLLVPRMTTTQRTATAFTTNLSSADNGLMVYDEDLNKFFFWITNQWVELAVGNLSGLPDQVGQNGRYLITDGSNALWTDIDFSTLTNIPTGLEDGDDNTQLSDAEITAFGYIKSADDADNDPTNENQTVLAGAGISVNQVDQNFTITNIAPDQTVSLIDGGSGNITIGGTYPNLSIDVPSLDDADASTTNELQDLSLSTNTLSLSGSVATVDLSAYMDNTDIQNLDFTSGVISLSGDPDATIIDLSAYDSDVTDDFDGAFSSLSGIPSGLSDGDDVDDADADATNEFQDLNLSGNTLSLTNSAVTIDLSPFSVTNTDNQTLNLVGDNLTISGGNTIDISSINTNLTEAEVDAFANNNGYLTVEVDGSTTNEIQDISTDGTSGDISISSGSNLTINVDDADADPTNEDQTVSAGTGISVSQTGDDFQVINTSPDQTVSIANGGNVTITGTYPNFTLAVPNNLDNDPTNEDQTVSAGTGISVSQTGDDFQVTNTSPDQTVSISDAGSGNITVTGTYPNFTLDSPDELPTQTSQSGNFLTTNGTSPSWVSINESQWATNGASINYATGNVNIGSGTIPTSRLQLSTNNASSTISQLTISESNASSDASATFNNTGNAYTIGVDGTDDYFKISDATSLGTNDRLIIDPSGNVGINEPAPSARLDVVGTTELNGGVTATSTVDITGQLTVANDIEIPAANAYTYASAQTRQMSYHPTEFKEIRYDGTTFELVTPNAVNLYAYFTSASSTGQASASVPVKLPDGATVTQLDAWIVDNDASVSSSFVRVSAIRSETGLFNSNLTMAQVQTDQLTQSATVTQLVDNTIFGQVIDNSTYSYRLVFTANENSSLLQLHGVRITYTVLQAD